MVSPGPKDARLGRCYADRSQVRASAPAISKCGPATINLGWPTRSSSPDGVGPMGRIAVADPGDQVAVFGDDAASSASTSFLTESLTHLAHARHTLPEGCDSLPASWRTNIVIVSGSSSPRSSSPPASRCSSACRATVRDLDASLDHFYAETHFADLTVIGGDTDAIAQSFARIDGVAATNTRGTTTLSVFLQNGKTKVQGTIIGVPADGPTINDVSITAGRDFPDDTSNDVAVVEQHTADDLGVKPGDTVQALGLGNPAALDVVGVGLSPEYLLPAQSQQQVITTPGSFAVLFVPRAVAESLGGEATVPQVLVKYAAGVDRKELDRRLTTLATNNGAQLVQPRVDAAVERCDPGGAHRLPRGEHRRPGDRADRRRAGGRTGVRARRRPAPATPPARHHHRRCRGGRGGHRAGGRRHRRAGAGRVGAPPRARRREQPRRRAPRTPARRDRRRGRARHRSVDARRTTTTPLVSVLRSSPRWRPRPPSSASSHRAASSTPPRPRSTRRPASNR